MNIDKNGQWEFMGGKNPLLIELMGDVSVAPHAETVRESYTVKTGRKSVLRHIHMGCALFGAPTIHGIKYSTLEIKKKGGEFIKVAQVILKTTNAGHTPTYDATVNIPLDSGDVVRFLTEDGSTGGTSTFHYNAVILEIDY